MSRERRPMTARARIERPAGPPPRVTPPPPPSNPAMEATDPPAQVDTTAKPVTATPSPRASRRKAAPRYASGNPQASIPITLQLPHQLADQYRAKAKELEKTLGDILLLSIGKAGDQLSDLVAEMREPAQTVGAFVLSTPRISKETLTTVQVHTRTSNVTALDQLVVETDAGSRSRLARAALAYALPTM